jgi:hypothetical protein
MEAPPGSSAMMARTSGLWRYSPSSSVTRAASPSAMPRSMVEATSVAPRTAFHSRSLRRVASNRRKIRVTSEKDSAVTAASRQTMKAVRMALSRKLERRRCSFSGSW